jgi:molybdenum cofactor synthesis domain-containing protein
MEGRLARRRSIPSIRGSTASRTSFQWTNSSQSGATLKRAGPRELTPSKSLLSSLIVARTGQHLGEALRGLVAVVVDALFQGSLQRLGAPQGVAWSEPSLRGEPTRDGCGGSLRGPGCHARELKDAFDLRVSGRRHADRRCELINPFSRSCDHEWSLSKLPSAGMIARWVSVSRRARVLTVSDSVAAGVTTDRSGATLVEKLASAGFIVENATTLPDGAASVACALRELAADFSGQIVTTGGTGFSPNDQTPEGTLLVLEREAPGLAEAMRAVNPLGRLSRGGRQRARAKPAGQPTRRTRIARRGA